MDYYVGLDVSLEQTAVCVLDEDGQVIMERNVVSHPDDIGACLTALAGTIKRVGLEAGPLAPWLYSGLAERGLPAFCIEVRQMKAFAKASPVKTDRRDARLIAQRRIRSDDVMLSQLIDRITRRLYDRRSIVNNSA